MNVNVLKDNPDWWWALLAGGFCLTSTMCVWLVFKIFPVLLKLHRRWSAALSTSQIESWLDDNVGARLKRFMNPANGKHRLWNGVKAQAQP
jgi:hypothetical protein